MSQREKKESGGCVLLSTGGIELPWRCSLCIFFVKKKCFPIPPFLPRKGVEMYVCSTVAPVEVDSVRERERRGRGGNGKDR